MTAAVFRTIKITNFDYKYKYVYNLKKAPKLEFIEGKNVSNESYGEEEDTHFTSRTLFLSLLIFAIN